VTWKTIILAVAGVGRPYSGRADIGRPASDFSSRKESDFPEWLWSHTDYGDAAI